MAEWNPEKVKKKEKNKQKGKIFSEKKIPNPIGNRTHDLPDTGWNALPLVSGRLVISEVIQNRDLCHRTCITQVRAIIYIFILVLHYKKNRRKETQFVIVKTSNSVCRLGVFYSNAIRPYRSKNTTLCQSLSNEKEKAFKFCVENTSLRLFKNIYGLLRRTRMSFMSELPILRSCVASSAK